MQLSYWEWKQVFGRVDYTVVGSGIVGLQCALHLRTLYPQARIVVLERGVLPQGASTKNAGFACFGSASELLDDLHNHTEDEVLALVQKRWSGFQLLRQQLGDTAIGFQPFGGYEVFLDSQSSLQAQCRAQLPYLNAMLRPLFKTDVYSWQVDRFDFKRTDPYVLFNPFEGQIDTGLMMDALVNKAQQAGIRILNGIELRQYAAGQGQVAVDTSVFDFHTQHLLFATNGFAGAITQNEVQPGRAQVLITAPIPGLDIKGTFHLDRGYYYFRNIDDRILLGGGRHLDFAGETTTSMHLNTHIQDQLEQLLRHTILPGTDVAIERRWSGIMGLGAHKNPIVKTIAPGVHCGVRLGGMGVALGTQVGRDLAALAG